MQAKDDRKNIEREAKGARTRFSRGRLLQVAAAGVAIASVPGVSKAEAFPRRIEFPFFPQVKGTYTPEDVQEILNVLLTLERYAVAVITANLLGPTQPGLHPLFIPIEQSALVASLAHSDFLESLGAQSLTETFSLPAVGESVAGLAGKERSTAIFFGAYLTAAREFAELGQPLLVKWAVQAGATNAEHRALARVVQTLQGVPNKMPPANKAFETDLFLHVRDAYTLMTNLGFFGKFPVRVPYPSRAQILTAAGPMVDLVLEKTPNNATSG